MGGGIFRLYCLFSWAICSSWFWNLSKSPSLNKWKQWVMKLVMVGNVSSWFWNLTWAEIFHMRIKKQLRSSLSKKVINTIIIRIQRFNDNYSFSSSICENGLNELEGDVASLKNSDEYFSLLKEVTTESRGKLKTASLLLKDDIDEEQKTIAYYKSSLLKENVNYSSTNNINLRNIHKLIVSNAAQTTTFLLATQLAFGSAVTIKLNSFAELPVQNFSTYNHSFLVDSEIKQVTKDKMPASHTETGENSYLDIYHFLKTSETKYDLRLQNNTFLNNVITKNSSQFFSNSENFKKNPVTDIGKSAEIVFSDAFKKNMEILQSEIDNLTVALTKENNLYRFKRSTVINSNTIKSTHSGSFSKPNSSSKIGSIENQLNKMKKTIEALKKTSPETEKRVAILENSEQNLETLFATYRRESEQKHANLENQITELLNSLNDNNKSLDLLRNKVADQENERKQNELKHECIRNIQNQNFKVAEEKLKLLNDSKIHFVVEEVYNNSKANFDLLLRFAENFSGGSENTKTIFSIYKALSDAIDDTEKIDNLITSLERKIMYQKNNSIALKKEVYSFLGKLLDKLFKGNIDPLSHEVIGNLDVFKSFEQAMEERGINVSTAKDNTGCNFLHMAAMHDHLEIVKYLINKKGVDVYVKNNVGSTPLHYAAMNGHLDVIRYLLNVKHVDVNVKNNLGSTALHAAAMSGHLLIVKYLISEKLATVSVNSRNSTPLDYAAFNGHLNVVKYLVDGRYASFENEMCKSLRIRGKHGDVVAYLQLKGATC